jgi:hypothetical protein
VASAPLFDGRQRDDVAFKRASETTYGFLDRIARPDLAWPRDPLNAWFSRWPEDDRDELRARFMAKDPASFTGALWELYLHEVHVRLGFSVERDPVLKDRRTRPDFLMTRGDDRFYLEATVAGLPTATRSARQRENELIEMINHASSPDFRVRVRGVSVGPTTPSRRKVVAVVERWLATLDLEVERARLRVPLEQPVHLEIDGTHLFVCPWPAPDDGWGPGLPMVITRSGPGGVVNEAPMLLDDLKDKASKFGQLGAPYVIALLADRDFTMDNDVLQALYGPDVIQIAVTPEGPAGDPVSGRTPRGFWQHDDQVRATRVSGVLSAVLLNPWSLAHVTPHFWPNPWAKHPLTADLPWAATIANLDENRLEQRPGSITAGGLLGLAPPDAH